MNAPIRVDSGEVLGLPTDRLCAAEQLELRRLVGEWEQHDTAARALRERIQLLLLVAKDRRRIVGPIEVDPADGVIVRIERRESDG